jgi:succinoglycan biosynthesis protein ExoL
LKKIAYFVHDLSDAAVHRRVRMLTAGGMTVTPIGFRRTPAPIDEVEGIAAIDLGQTSDGKLAKRALSVVRALTKLGSLADELRGVDAILARNLEMLVVAARARSRYAPRATLIYECLDIHRMLLSKRLDGRLLRFLESRIWRDVDLLLTSSPAFIGNYFSPRGFPSPIRLVEHKVLMPDEDRSGAVHVRTNGPPWRIGWFGMIRCRKSLDILSAIARETEGAVQVLIRGRPSAAVFDNFEETIRRLPHVQFGGAYRSADLPALYGEIHFAWAVDYFEQGQNSAWLLPNRLYEGAFYGSVPIALAEVETGGWLSQRGVGVVIEEPLERKLIDFFRQLTDYGYAKLASQVRGLPRRDLAFDRSDCHDLVEALCEK